ncbi:zinc metalloproteinase-disintegrin-like VLAIP-B [Anticarsia gemmatalis]|uniref:zinc metalloproteinase-disintegrin-like VLAIP-B n=1 Tax=Anticarsia gemmatalis TaxID=129554 RepID=UPI003F75D44B
MFGNNSILWLVSCTFLVLTKGPADAKELRPPASDFSRHRIVQPVVRHARTKREISTTRDTDGVHHSELTIKLPIDGEEHILDLRLNQDLIPQHHVLRYEENGETVHHKPEKEELDLCQYVGTLRGRPRSWAAVSTCHGLQGILADGDSVRYIEPVHEGDISSPHYVYEHADLTASHRCGHDAAAISTLHNVLHNNTVQRSKRQASWKGSPPQQSLHGPYTENSNSRYVELVLVADYELCRKHGPRQKVHHLLKTLTNFIYAVYAPLNIFISLVGVELWTSGDKIPLQSNSDTTLKSFTDYRKNTLLKKIHNDNAHLLTMTRFDLGVVGKAYKHAMCSSALSGGVASNHTEVTGLLAMTIAHEMGHNFGMDHDEPHCKCPANQCIMGDTSTSFTPSRWSSCSLDTLAESFTSGLDYCLRNKPKRLFESPTCGNGFVEAGEQCDCGASARGACLACCDRATCMLRANATCGAGTCCDFSTCRPKSAGTVCRSAGRECDLPEYCTGHSEFCPDDVYKMDTTPCGKMELAAYCVDGFCRSHTSQCRLLWGTAASTSNQVCYSQYNGKCNSYDDVTNVYRPCEPRDALCGRLHCTHLETDKGKRLKFGKGSYTGGTIMSSDGNVHQCVSANIDLGLDVKDPGLVPDGAICGEGMMCRNQRCVHVSAVRDVIAREPSAVCPSNCSRHGVCNSAGHCHCDFGFAPPLCDGPGAGGSVDSGPASDQPAALKRFMIAMYVIFLGIVPLILLVLFLIYRYRPDVLRKCSDSLRKLLRFNSNNSHTKPDAKDSSQEVLNNVDIVDTMVHKPLVNIVIPRPHVKNSPSVKTCTVTDTIISTHVFNHPVTPFKTKTTQVQSNIDVENTVKIYENLLPNNRKKVIPDKPVRKFVAKCELNDTKQKPNVELVKGSVSTTNKMISNSQNVNRNMPSHNLAQTSSLHGKVQTGGPRPPIVLPKRPAPIAPPNIKH